VSLFDGALDELFAWMPFPDQEQTYVWRSTTIFRTHLHFIWFGIRACTWHPPASSHFTELTAFFDRHLEK
jgi:hypothetical protein